MEGSEQGKVLKKFANVGGVKSENIGEALD